MSCPMLVLQLPEFLIFLNLHKIMSCYEWFQMVEQQPLKWTNSGFQSTEEPHKLV
jgi:hypothetical protein